MKGSVHPDEPVAFNANDPEQVQKRQIESLRREKESREVLVTLLSSRAGRAWMYELLDACHIYRTSFRSDAMEMSFAEGERNIGLRLLSQITATAPDALLLMLSERA
jgi:hypothetical protein